jgi:arsenite-transporting ATPase
VSALDALLARLPRTTLVVGKGGVGKTTCAAGIATALAAGGSRTLLVSTDPAAALANVMATPVEDTAAPVAGADRLDARQLSTPGLRREFLLRWRDTIADIIDRGTYLDRADVDGLVDAALPGADEIFALLALGELIADAASPYARIVVDTAPTGHTLRLLALPDTFRALVAMLDAMQDKHRFMVRALTHRYRSDGADEFLAEMRRRIDGIRSALSDPSSVAAVLVARAEPVVAAETVRYAAALGEARIALAAVVVNALPSVLDETSREGVRMLETIGGDVAQLVIPVSTQAPRGIAAISHAVGSMTVRAGIVAGRATVTRAAGTVGQTAGRVVPGELTRALTIVGGKGGVGKTTVACALAIAAADDLDAPVLLVSTDPAPSIADALGETDAPWSRRDEEHEPREVPGLVVRQMDATAAFARLRDAYQDRIDALFDSLVARGVDVAHDRAILRDLLALAPPGIDELYALSVLGDALHQGRFARIVVDPAPTGHLLRLIEMPALALEWSHQLMRLMLKYREVAGLGDAAQELLDFARRTRALDELLRDRARAGMALVALDEPVVRDETTRLVEAVRMRGVDVHAIIWNRVVDSPAPLPVEPFVAQVLAGATTPPPVGAAALRAWSRDWHRLTRAH